MDAGEPPKPKGHYMTALQLAEYLQVSKGTIHNWKYQRKNPYSKIGRRVRFKKGRHCTVVWGQKGQSKLW